MLIVSKSKIIFAVIVCFFGLLFAIPSAIDQKTYDSLPKFMQHTVNLGLELRGGSHLQLEVDIKSVLKEYIEEILNEVRKQLRKSNIKYQKMNVNNDNSGCTIEINLQKESDFSAVEKIMLKIESDLQINKKDHVLVAKMSSEFINKFQKRIVNESIEVIRRRIDETGTKEPTILRQGNDRIILQLPGVENPAEVKSLLGQTAMLTFHAVDEGMQVITATNGETPNIPTYSDVVYLPEDRGDGVVLYIPVKKQILLTGKALIDAQMNISQETGMPCVEIKFDKIYGSKRIAELSYQYLNKQFAMVLDGKVLSAPVFRAVLTNGMAVISGNFVAEEASKLALLLRAGSLPAPLKVVEERNIGPSLGMDSIASGKNATILAFALVSIFMILAYGMFGTFSVISLGINITLLFAALTLLGATLTLPGIAGIALTIGMAVDSNVLIYERIREEIRLGIKTISAVEQGYKMAKMTILDSNFTTLVGSIVLYEFGSGPIRGFAVTLALGTVISLFTTFFVTKSLIAFSLKKNSNIII